jgi:ATPase
MIPQVVDTVVMIDGGAIGKVYELTHTVKVPAGMREQDLARPVIEVRDFESGRVEYEIYKFGDEVVVLPIGAKGKPGGDSARMDLPLERKLGQMFSDNFSVEKNRDGFVVHASHRDIITAFKMHKKKLRQMEDRFGPIEFREN